MQTSLSPYPIGAEWCEQHPDAAAMAEAIARSANVTGRAASFRDEVLPVLRANAHRYGLTDDPTQMYAMTHNIVAEIARHLEWACGVQFTKRKAACDRQGTYATPDVV